MHKPSYLGDQQLWLPGMHRSNLRPSSLISMQEASTMYVLPGSFQRSISKRCPNESHQDVTCDWAIKKKKTFLCVLDQRTHKGMEAVCTKLDNGDKETAAVDCWNHWS